MSTIEQAVRGVHRKKALYRMLRAYGNSPAHAAFKLFVNVAFGVRVHIRPGHMI